MCVMCIHAVMAGRVVQLAVLVASANGFNLQWIFSYIYLIFYNFNIVCVVKATIERDGTVLALDKRHECHVWLSLASWVEKLGRASSCNFPKLSPKEIMSAQNFNYVSNFFKIIFIPQILHVCTTMF